MRCTVYRNFGKRFIDFVGSIIGLLLCAPLFLLISIWIKATSKGPVFFKQKRIGKDKKYFEILKFRTMYADTPKDVPTHLLQDPARLITPCGKILRKTSLDELPQLINILKGEMSIIGPRPALWNQEDLIQQRDLYGANALVPGLTGWAQVNGRDELPIPIKAKYDGEYAANLSFWLDIKIFFKTLGSAFFGKGVVEGEVKQNCEKE